jgi:hypothetical protein
MLENKAKLSYDLTCLMSDMPNLNSFIYLTHNFIFIQLLFDIVRTTREARKKSENDSL